MKKLDFFLLVSSILYLTSGIPPTQMLRWAGIVHNCYDVEVYPSAGSGSELVEDLFETKCSDEMSGLGGILVK